MPREAETKTAMRVPERRLHWQAILALTVGGLPLGCTDSTSSGPVPAQLEFTVQPLDATAGAAISPSVAVAIEDAGGNTVTSATQEVTLTIGQHAIGGTLSGTVTAVAVNGVATFPNLRITKAGTGYTLMAVAQGLPTAESRGFGIVAGPAAALLFSVQPVNVLGGVAITPPVEVTAQDSVGNRADGFRSSVTVALAGTWAPGTFAGTTVVTAVNGVATFSDLSIAQVGSGYLLTASAAGLRSVTSAHFSVARPMATLRLSAVTSGNGPDPDGYSACVDPASDDHGGITCAYGGPFAIGVGRTATVAVDTGGHSLQLNGVAANCAVAGDNPRTFVTPPGATVSVSLAVACSLPTLHVTTTTTGSSLVPTAYGLCIDSGDWGCSSIATIGVNGAVTIPVAPGAHEVELEGVAANCSVNANPQTVEAGTATEVPFVITCVAAGAVRVTTTVTGIDLDPAYTVCVSSAGEGCAIWAGTTVSYPVTLFGVSAGPQTVTFSDVAPNCTVAGSTTRTIIVPQDGIVDVALDVNCVAAERIAFSVDGMIRISRVDVSDAHAITPGFAPAWSPDGVRLAYQCAQDICAINADSTGFAQLTMDAAANRHPTWSPDGSRIAFAAKHAGVTDLYVMAANGSGAARLTQGMGFVGSPAWSPDGTKIVFDCQVDTGNGDLCSVHADGTGFSRLTSDPARDYGAAWKPDGSALAFATTRYGPDEIVLMSPAGGGVSRLGAGLPGFEPAWSPDGAHLALVQRYQDTNGSAHDIIQEVDIDGANIRGLGLGYEPAWKPHP
jgi:hypothetical protein